MIFGKDTSLISPTVVALIIWVCSPMMGAAF